MLVRLRREYAQLVTSGAQLLLLLVGFKLESHTGWLACLSIMAVLSVMAWLSALKRLRMVRDTPTSKIASAAQGYVELAGRGQPFVAPLTGKLSKLPCLWYKYRIEHRQSNKEWKPVGNGESEDLFMLRDDTGECIVDPEHAEILTSHREQWQQGVYRYTEWRLIEQDHLYAIGQFHTHNNAVEFDSRAEMDALLTEWKKNVPELHARFDLDNNGTLDMQEWMLARSAARREVAKKKREADMQPNTHVISCPRDGKLFLISNLDQYDLSRRYLFWAWAHLVIFFGALGGFGWLVQTPAHILGLQK